MITTSALILLSLLAVPPQKTTPPRGLELPRLFSDHMVLQQGKPVLIWGRDKPGTKLVVRFGDQEKKCKVRLDGSWALKLDPLKPGPARKLIITGSSEKRIQDVLVGEVWFCSGQSNMAWVLEKSRKGAEAIKTATEDEIRLFKTQRTASERQRVDVKGGTWKRAQPESAQSFSAVAWYFGRQLHKALGVPIGLVECDWGGTRIQAWMSPKALQNKIFDDLRKKWNRYDKKVETWQKRHDKWSSAAERARRMGKPVPREPRQGRKLHEKHRPGGLFMGMAGPLLPYAYAGVIWYQGEANLREASRYANYMRILVQDWRRVSQQDLPFYWVQLASFDYRNTSERQLALLWEAQDQARSVQRTGMASAVDLGHPKDIHPKNKSEVGLRLSLLALAEVYGQQVESSGPRLLSWKKKGREVHLLFSHCDGGLVAKGPLRGFEIAGSKKKFFPAQARIQGQGIILTCPEVKSAQALRYAFHELGPFPVYNQQGLPLTPFRTDDWIIKGQ